MTKKEFYIAVLNREIAMRKNLYPKWIVSGKMSKEEADKQIQAMIEIKNIIQNADAPDKLAEIFKMQKELMEIIQMRTGVTGTVHGAITAMIVEAGEFLNENGEFKWWKKKHKADPQKELDEFIDIFFFWLQAAIKKGYTPEMIFEAYKRKWQINIDRQRNNY